MDGLRLSLVIPAHNEQANLRQAIAEADSVLAELCEDYEILVVDDGSRDDTAAIAAEEAAVRPRVRLLRHAANRGYGAALRTGFEAARYDLVAFTDADCQFYLDDLASLVPLTETAPIATGWRIDRKDPWRRRFLSGGYNLLARTLLGTNVRDIDCALKVFRREALLRILPESPGFFANAEMFTRARQLGLDIAEVGVRHRPRLAGRSTVSLREVPRTLGRLLPFWWTRVLFPGMARAEEESESPSRAGIVGLALLLVMASLLFFLRLRAPLLEPQEGRYAEIPRQMLLRGDWITPYLNEQPYLDKPPLLYWSVMGAYKLYGVADRSARLVPGLAGLLLVLVTTLWGRAALGERAGLCGGAVLCLMPELVYRGRMLSFDILLALWVTAALAAAHVAMLGPRFRPGWWLIGAIACGLGLLTKGPVALALVGVPVVALAWIDPRLSRPGLRGWLAFVAVSVAIAAPWYVAVCLRDPAFAGYFFWKHNVVRFVAPFDHARPMWFYLPGLLLGLMPWTLLLPGLARVVFDRSARTGERRPQMLAFFSAAGCKRPTYLLPALPPLALALGWVIHLGAPRWRDLLARGSTPATWAAVATLVGAVGIAGTGTALHIVRPDVGLFLCAGGVLGLTLLVALPSRVSWAASASIVLAALLVGVWFLQPTYNKQFSLRAALRRHLRDSDRARPVVCYPQRYESAGFYLPDNPVRVFGVDQSEQMGAYLRANPGTLLLVKSGHAFDRMIAELPPALEFRTRQRRGAVMVGRVVERPTTVARQR
jgi:4-amino-4-deoxy-L-arabinose transferase-like glycosyltransferase